MNYCKEVYTTKRFSTREVRVGNIGVGGDNPIRIQSMTTSNTRDVEATIEQTLRLVEAGCEIVRVTVQGMKEALACEKIKEGLLQRGVDVPLVADIHFYPPAAMKVVEFVDKVRVNPGNFADRRATFQELNFNEASYALELEKIEEKFAPLVEKCKQYDCALRIGTNHGSLSDRIMSHYGDTPAGMVESALEFARICRKLGFHEMIFSMKASNPQVMIQAYRLLNAKMMELGWNYPLHLGVTEAGEGEDGRIKSAMGIGSLLLDGLGDTIRVSLTEDPWHEIKPCRALAKIAESSWEKGVEPFEETQRTSFALTKREVALPKTLSLHRDGSVFLSVKNSPALFEEIGCKIVAEKPKVTVDSADSLYFPEGLDDKTRELLLDAGVGILEPITVKQALEQKTQASFSLPLSNNLAERALIVEESEEYSAVKELQPAVILLRAKKAPLHFARKFFDWMKQESLAIPVILNFSYSGPEEETLLRAAAECGALLCDGLGEGLWLEGPYDTKFLRELSFSILQAARMRLVKTDFISCPSCGRTLFNLQEVTKKIQARTAHLPGVKIAIMGCIVNGPGEMADADFGYVGSRPGKIDLYVGKECVEKNIDFADADDRLVALIKSHNRWVPEPA